MSESVGNEPDLYALEDAVVDLQVRALYAKYDSTPHEKARAGAIAQVLGGLLLVLVGLEAESLADADVLMTCVAIYLIDPKEWTAAALRQKRRAKSDPSTMTFDEAEREAERDSKLRTALRRKLRRAPPPGERSSQAAK